MHLRKKVNKNRKSQFIIIGSLFLILSDICIISLKYYQNYLDNNIEKQKIDEFMLKQKVVDLPASNTQE